MFKILIVTAFAWLVVGSIFTLMSFVTFDRLLQQIKKESDAAWIELGRPVGFFWVPSGVTSLVDSGFVRGELYRQWPTNLITSTSNAAVVARLKFFRRMGCVCFAAGLIQLLAAIGILFV
jgi:hypothetical protein